MLHIDYTWDLQEDGILLDDELKTSQLGWEEGDIFKLVTVCGRRKLIKMEAVEQFVKGYKVNGRVSQPGQ
jgi:hypothetical protein